MARPGPLAVFEPIGTRLIDSTPQAMATSTAPAATRLAARLVACWLEPHWLSTVVAATVRGRPAASQAVRAMLKDCSPDIVTHPPTTWSTSVGSIPARSTQAFCTAPNRSAGCMVDSPPPRRPMGLRTASTITTSGMVRTLSGLALHGIGQCLAGLLETAPADLLGALVDAGPVGGGLDEEQLRLLHAHEHDR